MLKYLAAKEKILSRDLWEEAFPEDSKSFDDYYYREKTRDNRILAAVEDGQVQAMVQMNPYLLQAGGRRWRGNPEGEEAPGLYATPVGADDGGYAGRTDAVLLSDACGGGDLPSFWFHVYFPAA